MQARLQRMHRTKLAVQGFLETPAQLQMILQGKGPRGPGESQDLSQHVVTANGTTLPETESSQQRTGRVTGDPASVPGSWESAPVHPAKQPQQEPREKHPARVLCSEDYYTGGRTQHMKV